MPDVRRDVFWVPSCIKGKARTQIRVYATRKTRLTLEAMDAHNIFLHAMKLHQAGKLFQAIALYKEALKADPNLGEAALYMGMALQLSEEFVDAEAAYIKAAELLPGDPDPINNLGTVQLALGKIEAAKASHLTALNMVPESADAMAGLGNVHMIEGNFDEAIASFNKALAIDPNNSDILNNLGVALKSSGHAVKAVRVLENALSLNPASAEILYNLGNAWQMRGDMSMARRCFDNAQKSEPSNVAAHWGGTFAHLETLYETDEELATARNNYAASLRQLDAFLTLDTPAQIRDAAEAVGANQPFYLTYQGKNDRELQSLYGTLVHRIMTTAYPHLSATSSPRRRHKIRVGIATGFMHEHSVWKIPTRGWVKHLDRNRFEVYGYYTGVKDDHCTEEARQLFDSFTHEPYHFEELCSVILRDDLDVLIYPDIGMDPTCAKLAGLRLAPSQCVSLGHPMTTGLPTMDYFLSSDLMEPEDGEQAYTEQLIRLPNLSVHYTPLRQGAPKFDRQHFGLPEDVTIYFCPQSLYKYLPSHDQLYPLIARSVPGCHFVFLESNIADKLNAHFRKRLANSFTDHGLEFGQYVTMLPYQGPEEYHALNCICDIFLDSIEWSGFNTAMEAANADLPAITLPRGHMRGRHSYAVVKRLGNDKAVAHSFAEYVALAVRMGTDAEFRNTIVRRTQENRPRLFNDMEAVRGLESFIERVARPLAE